MNINGVEILALLLAGLIIFGPDKLPKMISQAVHTLQQLRTLANSARSDLTDALGPQLQQLHESTGLGELRKLGDLNPRRMINDVISGEGWAAGGSNGTNGSNGSNGSSAGTHSNGANGAVGDHQPVPSTNGQPAPLPVVDPDAT
jgi:sec-independent protein translocase protein TatB